MKYKKIKIENIETYPEQVRSDFSERKIEELAKSIAEVGQLQPIVVQQKGDKYILIAGERRLRAIAKDGKDVIAAVILEEDLTSKKFRQIQLIENLQREDLNPLERAVSIQKFIDENNLSKKEAAEKIGVPRTTLMLWLNILSVKKKYQQEVLKEDSPISLSHISLAQALASKTGDPSKIDQLLDAVIKYNLSRRETQNVLDIFYKYLHMPMKEAVAAVLLKRAKSNVKLTAEEKKKTKKDKADEILKSLCRINDKAENFMEEIGTIKPEQQENLMDEFLYLYQIMGLLIPELKENDPKVLIDRIKQKNQASNYSGF
ncbi:ParB family chromosome partitioning protein [Halanaerobium sp. DL-01]|uniref:ParB/RepB/Spo0J family partition protein n=1 Tax=Halanaerobium sp. DL-01 TaxID=1653064 RepID=UPI000DF227A3|nr:ParB/RepB/Spo0J family partition protein [Halanaerobium sp. DL-01]RCW81079.1 ParB family chromosome partitioning protein [Halanaerobium sp. DL-01]